MISASERQATWTWCLCFLNAITAPFKELPDRGFFRPIDLLTEDNKFKLWYQNQCRYLHICIIQHKKDNFYVLAAPLQELYISGCPILRKRYGKEEMGEGWQKISHIPDIYFDDILLYVRKTELFN
jgi:hypothetical protein